MAKRIVEQLEDEQRLSDDPRVLRMIEGATKSIKAKLDRSEAMRRHAEDDLEKAEQRVDFIRRLDDPHPHAIDFKPRKASGNASEIGRAHV